MNFRDDGSTRIKLESDAGTLLNMRLAQLIIIERYKGLFDSPFLSTEVKVPTYDDNGEPLGFAYYKLTITVDATLI